MNLLDCMTFKITTLSVGQARGWKSMISTYAIEAHNADDIAAGVRFATEHNLRLVVKGTGKQKSGLIHTLTVNKYLCR